jgi:hypothetical protein
VPECDIAVRTYERGRQLRRPQEKGCFHFAQQVSKANLLSPRAQSNAPTVLRVPLRKCGTSQSHAEALATGKRLFLESIHIPNSLRLALSSMISVRACAELHLANDCCQPGRLTRRRFTHSEEVQTASLRSESSRDEPVATQKDYRKRYRVNKSRVADWS